MDKLIREERTRELEQSRLSRTLREAYINQAEEVIGGVRARPSTSDKVKETAPGGINIQNTLHLQVITSDIRGVLVLPDFSTTRLQA